MTPMSTMYVFDESGLNALINHIKTTRNMADSNESAIGGLGEDLVGLTEAVQSELAGKQGTLTFDTTPTEGSSNPVTSDGVAQAIKANGGTPIVTATSADGKVYTATVEGMDSLEVGKEIIIIPDYTTTITNPTLNVNGLGAKYLRCTVAGNNTTTTTSSTNDWLYSGKPVKVRWNGSFWATDIIGSVDGNSISGIIEIENGGTGATTVEQALANLGGIAAGAVGNLHVWKRVQDVVTDYLTSTDPNAYTEGTVDRTTITYLGQLGEPAARIEVGSYVGTGTESADILLRSTPKAVLVSSYSSLSGSDGSRSAFILPGLPNELDVKRAEIIDGGFRVYYYSSANVSYSSYLNTSGNTYRYIAIG